MTLRPYQLAALETSKKKLEAGVTRQLIALPTGTGKTPLFASVPSFFGFKGRVMVLVHMEELANQAADKMRIWNPGAIVGIEMADRVAPDDAQIVIGSVPTLGREGSSRIQKFNPADFDAIITDEAHHSTSQSYRNIFDHFGLLAKDSKKLLLGVTATPNRGDGVPLAEVYDEIIYQMTVLEAIKQGWLVDMAGVRVCTGASLDGVHTRAGDFASNELSKEVNTPARNDLIVRNWIEKAKDRQTVAFTVDIAHAKALAESFARYGVAAQAIWGDDPDRASKLAEHRAGNLKVLCNCAVLTEGYDDPAIGCIVLARPTKSSLLFTQMIGRGTRLQPDIQNLVEAKASGVAITKEDCLLMDVVDNTTKHSLVTLSTIFGLGSKLDLNGANASQVVEAIDKAKQKNPNLDFNNLTDFKQLDSFVETVNLFEVKFPDLALKHSLLRWYPNTAKDAFVLMLPDDEHVTICTDLLGTYHVIGTVAGNKFHTTTGKDIAEAFRVGDSIITKYASHLLQDLKRRTDGQDDPAKQLTALRRRRSEILNQVLNLSPLHWCPNTAKDAFVLMLPDDESVVICQDLLGNYRIVGEVAGHKFNITIGKDISQALRQADAKVTMLAPHLLQQLKRPSGWHDDPATPKQLGFLRRVGIPTPAGLSKGDAAKKITQYMAQLGRPWYMQKKGVI